MPSSADALLPRRTQLLTLFDVITSFADSEAAWAQAVCDAAVSTIPAALGVGLQVVEHDGPHVLNARTYGAATTHTPISVLLERPHALRTPREHVLLVTEPRPDVLLTLVLKFGDHRAPTANDQRLFRELRLALQTGATAVTDDAIAGVLTMGAQVLEGTVDVDTLWHALRDGRYRLQPCGDITYRRVLVVDNPVHQRHARELSELEHTVLTRAARGLTGKQQAWELNITQSGVSRLLGNACSKLGFVHTPEAIRFVGALLKEPGITTGTLTSSERLVLELVKQGLSNRDIAQRRERSVRTIANQVAALLRKTGAPGRRALYPVEVVSS